MKTSVHAYFSSDEKQIKEKRRVLADHFGLPLTKVDLPDLDIDPEEFSLIIGVKNIVYVECVHVSSLSFKDTGWDAYTKLIGNNPYYFRLL